MPEIDKINQHNKQFAKEITIRIVPSIVLFPIAIILKFSGLSHAVFSACAACCVFAIPRANKSARQENSFFNPTTLCVACYILFSFLFMPVAFDVIAVAVILMLEGSINKQIRTQIHNERKKNLSNSEQTIKKNELTELLLATGGVDDILRLLTTFVHHTCGYPVLLFRVDSTDVTRIFSEPAGVIIYSTDDAAIQCAAKLRSSSGRGTQYCVNSVYRCYPLNTAEDNSCYVIAILLGTKNNNNELYLFLDSIFEKGYTALERQRLVDAQQKTNMEKQLEYMRSNFLRAISHDLRSPLAAIGAACHALNQTPDLSENNRNLINDIREESEWLTQMVENLLSVTRLDADSPQLNLTGEAVEEIVGEAAYKCRTRFPMLQLEVSVPEEIMIVQMDATLITQVILNLVENAVKYSGEEKRVLLTVVRDNSWAVFTVRDFGAGIPTSNPDILFGGKRIMRDDSRNGLGIGLSICKTIVDSHHGSISARNCEDDGAIFTFTLPLEVNDN